MPSKPLNWRRSDRCSNGACLEFAATGNGVLFRDSKDPNGPVFTFDRAEWVAFLAGAKAGDFDDLAGGV